MNLFISFSGGKTSAFMTKWLLENRKNDYEEILVLFANTGQEHEETLNFVERCDKEWGLNVIWLEVAVNPEFGKGSRFKVVNFESASRNGKPFEDVIKKYGIPNNTAPLCTRELKLAPMNSYIKLLGWKKGDYKTAIGIRADEMDRVNSKMEELNIIYPLCEDTRQSKKSINDWWEKQPFNLEIPEHKGNCVWCWKKSKRKLLTLAKENPAFFEFPIKMERLYGKSGNYKKDENRVFFRDRKSGLDIVKESKSNFTPFNPSEGVNPNSDIFDFILDTADGCSESCEVY